MEQFIGWLAASGFHIAILTQREAGYDTMGESGTLKKFLLV